MCKLVKECLKNYKQKIESTPDTYSFACHQPYASDVDNRLVQETLVHLIYDQ